jgi:hypothetical protein
LLDTDSDVCLLDGVDPVTDETADVFPVAGVLVYTCAPLLVISEASLLAIRLASNPDCALFSLADVCLLLAGPSVFADAAPSLRNDEKLLPRGFS